jgi:CheY-like chemotaxis protein
VFSLGFRIGGIDGSLGGVPRILVIEDHEPLWESAVRILSAAGYDVRAASSGAEGLRTWRELGADLVLTDARMGDVSGLEIILQLRAAAASALAQARTAAEQ